MNLQQDTTDILTSLGVEPARFHAGSLAVTSPIDGSVIAQMKEDNIAEVAQKVAQARSAQQQWEQTSPQMREAFLTFLADHVRSHKQALGKLITLEAGKTTPEAEAEAEGSAVVMTKTIATNKLADMGSVERSKNRKPVGVVGVITSYNFPLLVANWNIAPALLAGNAVLWKGSEKTPIVAAAYEKIFQQAAQAFNHLQGSEVVPQHLVQVATGGRETGAALVANEGVDMISATGSVGMGKAIEATLAKKSNPGATPILELGGNNAIIISEKNSPEYLERALDAILQSAFGTAGQRCTDTRRLIIQEDIYEKVIGRLKEKYQEFVDSGAIKSPLEAQPNAYGFGPLIDKEVYDRFQHALDEAQKEGGVVHFGLRLFEQEKPNAYYTQPALVEMPEQKPGGIMHEETFAPVLFVTKYRTMDEAIALANAPDNAGLVNGIYTQDEAEVQAFAAGNKAGHSVINMPKGTGTPAHDMGFGGNKASGCGEILNAADPLKPFSTHANRVARDKTVPLSWGKASS